MDVWFPFHMPRQMEEVKDDQQPNQDEEAPKAISVVVAAKNTDSTMKKKWLRHFRGE